MVHLLSAPTGSVYDAAGHSFDSHGALMLDDKVARESVEAGARIIPIGTYRVGNHLRSAQMYQHITPAAAQMIQSVFRKKLSVITGIQ